MIKQMTFMVSEVEKADLDKRGYSDFYFFPKETYKICYPDCIFSCFSEKMTIKMIFFV